MSTASILKLVISAVAAVAFFIAKNYIKHKPDDSIQPKKKKRLNRLFFFGLILSAWYFVACVVNEIEGGLKGIHVEFEMFPERVNIFGLSVAKTTVTTWYIIAVIFVLSLIFRLFVFPRFKESPKGLQNAVELLVEAADKFTAEQTHSLSPVLGEYIFSLAIMMIGCAAVELFSVRPPTSDLTFTFSLGLLTFILINLYGIKKKGFFGRIKALAKPNPIIMPMKMLSDCAVPVSLACRLFGNMLGGMIVMDLLKTSLGGYAVGLTSLAGLYFNIFHPLIQTYIFIILTLTFINEATE
ncbi:MAG: F0F1 ATP synthase subunit A [Clostridiales bacterium]|nr:F0F1 ATP synthase subunit A [Clostridiales bacterium]